MLQLFPKLELRTARIGIIMAVLSKHRQLVSLIPILQIDQKIDQKSSAGLPIEAELKTFYKSKVYSDTCLSQQPKDCPRGMASLHCISLRHACAVFCQRNVA